MTFALIVDDLDDNFVFHCRTTHQITLSGPSLTAPRRWAGYSSRPARPNWADRVGAPGVPVTSRAMGTGTTAPGADRRDTDCTPPLRTGRARRGCLMVR